MAKTHERFIASKTAAGFVVREAQAGRSTVTFDYFVVATKLGSAGQRMAMVSAAEARTFGARGRLPVTPRTPHAPSRPPATVVIQRGSAVAELSERRSESIENAPLAYCGARRYDDHECRGIASSMPRPFHYNTSRRKQGDRRATRSAYQRWSQPLQKRIAKGPVQTDAKTPERCNIFITSALKSSAVRFFIR